MHAGKKGEKEVKEREMKGGWQKCRETSVLMKEEQA